MIKTLRRALCLLSITILSGSSGSGMQAPVVGRPVPRPLATVSFPPYESMTLENGLRVFALQHSEQPVLSIQLVVGAGAANDPSDLPGLSTFTANLLETGTTTRTAQEIAEAIDTSGGSLTVIPGTEATTISASVLKDSTLLAFELMRDIVLTPAFQDDEIERLRQQSVSGLASDLQQPDFIADTVFRVELYGSHPYGHPTSGTPGALRRITRDDVVGFHQTWFAPETSALAIVGDLSTPEAFELAQEWFGGWERKNPPRPDLSLTETVDSTRIIIIDNPASVQTEIRIGQTTVGRNDGDYFPVLVTSYVLGGPEGRLMDSLRSDQGLTYGAYEALEPRRGPGSLYATTETRTETTVDAIQSIFREIGRIAEEPTPTDELEDVESFIIGSFPLTIEVPADLASRLTNLVVYGLGDDYLDTYRDRIAAVSSDDVTRIARDHLRSNDVLIVLVGRADAFRDQVTRFGTVEVIPQSELDLDALTLPVPVP